MREAPTIRRRARRTRVEPEGGLRTHENHDYPRKPRHDPDHEAERHSLCRRIEGAEPFEERPKAVQERLLAQLTPIVWSALPEILAQVEKAREKQVQAADGFVIPDSLEGLL